MTPTSRFFDMGSGVGTVVLQAALQAGCNASGIEKMVHPAGIATKQLEQFSKRCRMWGVEPGKAELLTGDFTNDDRVYERIVDADVVLCNNWAFSEKCASSLYRCAWEDADNIFHFTGE
jgi:[histone H3]-lysine79 N-trimethyltransferase